MQKVSNAMNISQLYPRRFANGNDIGASEASLPQNGNGRRPAQSRTAGVSPSRQVV